MGGLKIAFSARKIVERVPTKHLDEEDNHGLGVVRLTRGLA